MKCVLKSLGMLVVTLAVTGCGHDTSLVKEIENCVTGKMAIAAEIDTDSLDKKKEQLRLIQDQVNTLNETQKDFTQLMLAGKAGAAAIDSALAPVRFKVDSLRKVEQQISGDVFAMQKWMDTPSLVRECCDLAGQSGGVQVDESLYEEVLAKANLGKFSE